MLATTTIVEDAATVEDSLLSVTKLLPWLSSVVTVVVLSELLLLKSCDDVVCCAVALSCVEETILDVVLVCGVSETDEEAFVSIAADASFSLLLLVACEDEEPLALLVDAEVEVSTTDSVLASLAVACDTLLLLFVVASACAVPECKINPKLSAVNVIPEKSIHFFEAFFCALWYACTF